jgi:hypothetical protein
LLFSAKKRAEAAPGVGGETALFYFDNSRGTFRYVDKHLLATLFEAHRLVSSSQERAQAAAEEMVADHLENFIAPHQAAGEQAPAPENKPEG